MATEQHMPEGSQQADRIQSAPPAAAGVAPGAGPGESDAANSALLAELRAIRALASEQRDYLQYMAREQHELPMEIFVRMLLTAAVVLGSVTIFKMELAWAGPLTVAIAMILLSGVAWLISALPWFFSRKH